MGPGKARISPEKQIWVGFCFAYGGKIGLVVFFLRFPLSGYWAWSFLLSVSPPKALGTIGCTRRGSYSAKGRASAF